MAPSTVQAVLARYHCPPLAHLDRASGRRIRYERERPASRPKIGYSHLHHAVDDCSRLTCSEIMPDETKETAAAFWGTSHSGASHPPAASPTSPASTPSSSIQTPSSSI
jgi:hypothetical protein